MADDATDRRPVAPSREELVAAYKRLLQADLDKRPSGMRLKIAKAMGKHRSFVSQIANPAYSVPIPARHLETIFRICHFSPEERKAFLAAYGAAHPDQRLEGAPSRPRKTGRRTLEIELPASGNGAFDAAVDDIIRQVAKQIGRLARRS